MARMILGVYSDRTHAEDAVNSIKNLGIDAKDISIVMKDTRQAEEFADDTGANVAGGAVTGATTGAALGGIAGLLIGIGAISIPGIGALLIAGPIASALGLTGAAATTVSGALTGAAAGGLLGALMGLGLPEEDALIYEESIRAGGILVAVPAGHHTIEITEILEDTGADQIRTIRMKDDDIVDESAFVSTQYEPSGYYSPAGLKGGRTKKSHTVKKKKVRRTRA